MLIYRTELAAGALAAVITHFSQRSADDARHIPALPLPARTDLFLEFYLAEPYRVRQGSDTLVRSAPALALVAPHTRPGTELHILGRIDTFTVHFTATGCHRLFGCRLDELRDRAVLATDCLSHDVLQLRAALQAATSFGSRVAQANGYFEQILARARAADDLDHAALQMVALGGRVRVSALAQQARCSERHLARVFAQRTGLSPKLYARICRFHAALKGRPSAASGTLTQLALAGDYYDQAHFIRDCRDFTGQAPSGFLRRWTGPEHIGR